ncbi:MAG: hypothetical protein AAGB46_05335, partial [Verrucomicrobiota bacterium]
MRNIIERKANSLGFRFCDKDGTPAASSLLALILIQKAEPHLKHQRPPNNLLKPLASDGPSQSIRRFQIIPEATSIRSTSVPFA